MKLGFQIGRKLCTGSTVARQEKLVLTKTGSPDPSAASSWTSMSPVMNVLRGIRDRSNLSCATIPSGRMFSSRQI